MKLKCLSLPACVFAAFLLLAIVSAAPAAALVSTSGGGWWWLNPMPQGNALSATDWIDAQHGWAVGEYGTVLATGDGGATWQAQYAPTTTYLCAVSFAGLQHGWVASYDSVFGTTDGGQHWARQIDFLSMAPLRDIDFGSPLVGVFCGAEGLIYRTTDGGANWMKVTSGASGELFSVDMVSATDGWACGLLTAGSSDPVILRTTDGGASWVPQNPSATGAPFQSISAIDATTAFAVGPTAARRTTDGGAHWDSITSPGYVVGAAFADADRGWATDGISMQSTTDGGLTWSSQDAFSSSPIGLPPTGASIACVDAQHAYVAGAHRTRWNPTVFATSDGGATWSDGGSGIRKGAFFALSFPTATHGWVAGNAVEEGSSSVIARHDILRTTDGGATWTGKDLGFSSGVHDLDFFDAQRGCAVGVNFLAATSDGGDTWVQGAPTPTALPRAVDLVDETHGWAVGDDGYVVRTLDGGGYWTPQSIPEAYAGSDLFDVKFLDTQRGWAVGEAGLVLSTSDGGGNWDAEDVKAVAGRSLRGIFWLDGQRGWMVGDQSTIMRTTNAGATWTAASTGPVCAQLNSVSFSDSSHGWIVGQADNGTGVVVLRTVDGGRVWRMQGVGYGGYAAYGVTALSDDAAILCGDSFVMKTTSGGVSTIDSVMPTLAITKPKGTWHNHAVNVRLRPADASGIKTTQVRIGNEAYSGTSFRVGPGGVSDADGLKKVQAASVDVYGNASPTRTVLVGIDTAKPAKSWPLNRVSTASGSTAVFKFRINDRQPGCGKATTKLIIASRSKVLRTIRLGTVSTNRSVSKRVRVSLPRGTYWWGVDATDIAGNRIALKSIWFWTVTVR